MLRIASNLLTSIHKYLFYSLSSNQHQDNKIISIKIVGRIVSLIYSIIVSVLLYITFI